MSLLTSPQTTKEQHKFFSKMEKEYNKRSFLNQNYIESPHPFQQANESTQRAQEQLKQLMDGYLKSLRQIFQAANDHRIDYYFMLSQMKSRDFFNEVARIVSDSLVQRNAKLERDNGKLKQNLKKMHQELRDITRLKPSREKNQANSKFDAIKTVAENLYDKAKMLTGPEFIELCNKVILQEKVVIKKVADVETYRKWENQKNDKTQEKELFARVDSFVQKKSKQKQQDSQTELAKLIIDFKRINEQKESGFTCQRPCCNAIEEKIQMKSKASVLRRSSDSRRSSWIYKSDRSEEYFNRYYRRSEFDMHKILNVEKTKLEEMQKIEDDYRIAIKQRHKPNRSMAK